MAPSDSNSNVGRRHSHGEGVGRLIFAPVGVFLVILEVPFFFDLRSSYPPAQEIPQTHSCCDLILSSKVSK